MEHTTDKQLGTLLNRTFSDEVQRDDMLDIFVNNDPTKGLRTDDEFLLAIRNIIVYRLLVPIATATGNVSSIINMVKDTPLSLKKDDGGFTRLATNKMTKRIKHLIDNNKEVTPTIFINCDLWSYPTDGDISLTDFDLFTFGGIRNQSQTKSVSTLKPIDPALTFNPKKLPDDVKERFERKRDKVGYALGCDINKPFGPHFGKHTHYYHPVKPNAIILSDGTLFCQIDIDKKSIMKTQIPLTDLSPSGRRRWYAQYSTRMLAKGLFVDPLYALRPDRGQWGFTIGDSPNDDLPSTMYSLIHGSTGIIYQHLTSTCVLPSNSTLREQLLLANGDGYRALMMIIREVHPAYHPSPAEMVRAFPVQSADDSIEAYHLKFEDYLQLNAYIMNQDYTFNNQNIQDIFVINATHSEWLTDQVACRRTDTRYSSRYTHQHFLSEITSILLLHGSPTRKKPPPTCTTPPTNSWRRQRSQKGGRQPLGTSASPILINHLGTAADSDPPDEKEPTAEAPSPSNDDSPADTSSWFDEIPDTDEAQSMAGQMLLCLNRIQAQPDLATAKTCIFCKQPHSFAECPVVAHEKYLRNLAVRVQQWMDREANERRKTFPGTEAGKMHLGKPDF